LVAGSLNVNEIFCGTKEEEGSEEGRKQKRFSAHKPCERMNEIERERERV
jgi:hypothetical protein